MAEACKDCNVATAVAKGKCRRCYHREYAHSDQRQHYYSVNRERRRARDREYQRQRKAAGIKKSTGAPCTNCNEGPSVGQGLCRPCYNRQHYRTTNSYLSQHHDAIVRVPVPGWGYGG